MATSQRRPPTALHNNMTLQPEPTHLQSPREQDKALLKLEIPETEEIGEYGLLYNEFPGQNKTLMRPNVSRIQRALRYRSFNKKGRGQMSVYTIWTMYKTQRQDKKRVKPASAAYCFNLGRMAHAIELTRYPIGWEVPSVFPVSINNKFNHQKMLPKIASSSKRIHLVQMADYH